MAQPQTLQTETATADPARSHILGRLRDGRARTARELGAASEAVASALVALQQEGLVRIAEAGRHRYYTLRDSPATRAAIRRLPASLAVAGFVPGTSVHLRAARTCHDHLGGAVAVALFQRMHDEGWLEIRDGGVRVTVRGAERLAEMGVDVAASRRLRRRFAYACLDWSERRPHLAGALGAALLQALLRRRWLRRAPSARVLRVTAEGRRALEASFGCTDRGAAGADRPHPRSPISVAGARKSMTR